MSGKKSSENNTFRRVERHRNADDNCQWKIAKLFRYRKSRVAGVGIGRGERVSKKEEPNKRTEGQWWRVTWIDHDRRAVGSVSKLKRESRKFIEKYMRQMAIDSGRVICTKEGIIRQFTGNRGRLLQLTDLRIGYRKEEITIDF